MRDLADAARVSVPTVYNLVGGKVSSNEKRESGKAGSGWAPLTGFLDAG
jgi:hypothetical protein